MIERFPADACSLAHAAIAEHSRSYALIAQLLPAPTRDSVAVLHAYYRRAEDAIEFAAERELAAELRTLRAELDAVYAGSALTDPIASSFQLLVRTRTIPRVYADELLAGMETDARGARYVSQAELLRYCYRIGGTIGLMMGHVLGVRDDRALLHAAHLGMAMRLTDLCRDVLDDWQCGRLYLPSELLALHGAPRLHQELGAPFPDGAAKAVARTIAALLDLADALYASADAGTRYLSLRCAFAVRATRLIHAELGAEMRRRGCDPRAERVTVSASKQQLLVARAAAAALLDFSARALAEQPAVPSASIHITDTLLDPLPCPRAAERPASSVELGRPSP